LVEPVLPTIKRLIEGTAGGHFEIKRLIVGKTGPIRTDAASFGASCRKAD